MSTLADICKHAEGDWVAYKDSRTPPGYFAVTVKYLGVVTTYLLRGHDITQQTAPIVGRAEISGKRQVTYLGDRLKGGEYVGVPFSGLAALRTEKVGADPEPYVGWSGKRYALDGATSAALNDGPVEFDPRPQYAPTEDQR